VLRATLTPAEQRFWRAFREAFPTVRIRRQQPVGPYIADFLVASARLIVEIDGDTHASRRARDAHRDAWLMTSGYRVVRFANRDVNDSLDGVLHTLSALVNREMPHA
jgi:very-short-patch-repair endonuclease